jgi:thymidylate synthase ThyX
MDTLRLVDSSANEFLRGPVKVEEGKGTAGPTQSVPERLEEMINKVRKNDECFKVMKKEEFKDEYQKLLKNTSSKAIVNRSANKKKSFPSVKK